MPAEEHPEPATQPAGKPQRLARWIVPLLVLAILVGIVFVLFNKLRQEVWSYFTDDEGTRVEVQDEKTRYVLWEDPKQNLFAEQAEPAAPAAPVDPAVPVVPAAPADPAGPAAPADAVNQPSGRLEASFSANGTMMVLVRWDNKKANADLYLSQWDGRVWTRPAAITSLNTKFNERGPALSQDGRYLYFSSNREESQGGYDLFVARWNGQEWTGLEALGGTINTPANETGPALATDHSRLYFSSNRAGGGSKDIFVSKRLAVKAPEPAPPADPNAKPPEPPKPVDPNAPKVVELPPVPLFAKAEAVSHLNSGADDVQAALTTRGDHVFLASDRDRNDKAGFRVYFSRVVEGKSLPPEKVDLYIKKGDVTDPAVRMEGFDLLFSTGTEKKEDGYRLYRSTTREVIGYTDLSRWQQFKELMKNIAWWILLALAALAALLYLLEKWQDITSLFHKCLASSAAVHLLLLFLMMLWLIARELESGGEPQSPQVAVSIEALAQEALAMESEPDEAKIAETKNLVVTEKFDSDFKIPVFKAVTPTTKTPVVTSTSKTSLLPDVRPSKLNEAESEKTVELPTKDLEALTSLPESALPEPEIPELKEQEVTDQQKADKPADPTADLFVPTDSIESVETTQAKERKIAEAAVRDDTEAKEVDRGGAAPQATDTGGETIVAHRGLEADGSPPTLNGADTLVTTLMNLPGDDAQNDPLLPGALETPKHALDPKAITKLIQKQRGKPSLETIKQRGGSDATERAIGAALDWLARNQEPDGRWDVRKHGANGSYETAGSGLALLCFYGWDARHDRGGKYQDNVKRALEWLLKQQKENGDLRGGGRMYCHGIASIALCEAYGVTKDPKLKEPAERAIKLILASQSPTKGGWRYEPSGPNGPHQDADLSVTGWQYMALHSARLAGLEIPDDTFVRARRYLDEVSSGKHRGLYGYQAGGANPAMVATGMFCRQLDLVPPTDPRMPEGAVYLGQHPMPVNNPGFYYVYYATLALYQHQGDVWQKWNERLTETLPLIQKKAGAENGSWDPGSDHAASGGRVTSTTLGVLSLEVYYRLLPMYGFRANDDLPDAKKKAE